MIPFCLGLVLAVFVLFPTTAMGQVVNMTTVNNTLANSTIDTNTTTTNLKCSSSQIDIGGTCVSKAEVSKQIISITQSIMQKEDAKGVLLRVDVDNGTLV